MNKKDTDDSLDRLDRDLAAKQIQGYWLLGPENYSPYPATSIQPYIWRWSDVHDLLMRAGKVVNLENSERRTLRLINPGLKDRPFTTHTLQMSIQYVKPGEHARAHRHTMAALRFVVQGRGAFTTVNGQKCLMDEGDLILTPQLTWHDHSGGTEEPIIWLDGLDFPLVQGLHQLVFESYDQPTQPIQYSSEQVGPLYGHARPTPSPAPEFFHYKWHETNRTLRTLLESGGAEDPFNGTLLEYRNPATGGPTMTTIQCSLHHLRPSQKTHAHRHTSTVIYHAFRGAGTTVVGDKRFDWEQGDTFVVPVWHAHGHHNRSSSEEAMLFSMSDSPAFKSLGLYREEKVNP